MPDDSEVNSIHTELHIISSRPLSGILTSLGRNSSDLHCAPEIDLEPLVVIVVLADPGTDSMQSGKPRCVNVAEVRRRCDSRILDPVILKPDWIVAEALWRRKPKAIGN